MEAEASRQWDVHKYKSEFESEEHWQLRKKFMETHMDRFPEDKLVCLARVFFNVEFLGCRYPEKTMQLIAELSKGVADEHREKQKGKLKRTFVQASDAAGTKIKGTSRLIQDEPANKIAKTSGERLGYCSTHVNFTKPLPQSPMTNFFSNLIIFEPCNSNGCVETCPITILSNSVQKNGPKYTITYTNTERKCEIKINNQLLASGEGPTAKEARVNAAVKGLKILRTMCYTIQGKRAFFSSGPSILKDDKFRESETPLPQDNIGSRMMQKMGWSGSGLGKSQQGIKDPVQAAPQIMNRAGIGSVNQRELENKFSKVFKDYIRSGSESDLVFSPDFTPEERKALHRNPERNDDDGSCDFFGSDTEIDLKAEIEDLEDVYDDASDSELSQESVCCICSKLKLITGEETDSDIYDSVWHTGYELSSITLMNEYWEGTNNESGIKEINGEDSESDGSQEKLSTDKMTDTNQSTISKTTTFPRRLQITFNFPDGSYMKILYRLIIRNDVLRKYFFPEESYLIDNLPKTHNISKEELDSVPGLNESFKMYEGLRRFPLSEFEKLITDMEANGNQSKKSLVENANLKIRFNFSDGSYIRLPFQLLIRNNVLRKFVFPEDRLDHLQKIHNISNEELDSVPGLKENFKIYEGLRICPQSKKTEFEKEPVLERIKIFLPDGSYKRITFEQIVANRELREFIKYSDCKANVPYKHFATGKDLKTNAALRELFSDFLLSCKYSQSEVEANVKYHQRSTISEDFTKEFNETSAVLGKFSKEHSKELISTTEEATEKYNESSITVEEPSKRDDDGLKNVAVMPKYSSSSFQTYRNPDSTSKHGVQNTNCSLDLSSLQIVKNVNSSQSRYSLSINQQNKRRNKRKCSILLPDGSSKRLPLSIIACSQELSNIFQNRKPLTDEDFVEKKVLRQLFFDYWSKIKHKFPDNKCGREVTENLNQSVNVCQINIFDTKCPAATSSIEEMNNLCSISSTVNNNEDACENNDRPTMNQDVTEVTCGGNEKCSRDLSTSEVEMISYDKSANNQTTAQVQICSIGRSTTNQTISEVKWSSYNKCTPEQVFNECADKNVSEQTHNLNSGSWQYDLGNNKNVTLFDTFKSNTDKSMSSLVQAAKATNKSLKERWENFMEKIEAPKQILTAEQITFQLPSLQDNQEQNIGKKSEDFVRIGETQQETKIDNKISSIFLPDPGRFSDFATSHFKHTGTENGVLSQESVCTLQKQPASSDLENHINSSVVIVDYCGVSDNFEHVPSRKLNK